MTTTTSITISRTDEAVILTSPWAADLPAGAKRLGGRFRPSDRSWVFAVEDEDRVRTLARQIYGTDGTDSGTAVSLRITNFAAFHDNRTTAAILGRTLAHRPARDAPVRLGRGVVIVEGGFSGRGGSVRYPQLDETDDLVLEVRDVAAATAAQAVLRYPDDVEIVDPVHTGRTLLIAERDRLTTRLAELELELETSPE